MRNRTGRMADNESAVIAHKYGIAAQKKARRPTSPPAAAGGACGRVPAWFRPAPANRRPPLSRRRARAARRRRCDAAASGRREWPPIQDARNHGCRLPKGPRGILRAFRGSRPIVGPKSQAALSVATVSRRRGSLAYSLPAIARNAQPPRRFERYENPGLSGRHSLRAPIDPSPDTVPAARIGRKAARRQPVEVVVRPRFCQV